MTWILIDEQVESQIKTYAYAIDRIGCMVMVTTNNSSTMTLANGIQIVDKKLVAMEGYGYTPDDIEYDEDVDSIDDE